MVRAHPAADAGRLDPDRHRAAGLVRPRGLSRRQRPGQQLPGRLPRRDLLHDGHAQHDRLRRHRAGVDHRPDGQRDGDHTRPHRVPGAVDRHHPGGARLAGPRDVPGRPVEEEHARTRRRHRLRHQGAQRRRDARQQRLPPRQDRHRRPRSGRAAGRPDRRGGDRHRRRHPSRRASPRRGRPRQPGHHHHRPRRHQRARRAHRPPAQPGRLDRRRGARAGERHR